jgi:radical SAM protein with 4Fe4S-binding SPASM domain
LFIIKYKLIIHMKVLLEGNKLMYIKTKIINDASKYRLFKYIYVKQFKDDVLMYHLLTNCLVLLSVDEYKNYLNIPELKKLLFVVPDDYKDYDICQYYVKYFRKRYKHDKFYLLDTRKFVIDSTLNCNARCSYCYQKEFTIPKYNMNEHTTNNIIKLIKDCYKYHNQQIVLSLFGGEPLFYMKPYDNIVKELQNNNIPYITEITTNGYLLNDKNINKLINEYHLTQLQITVDNLNEKYNKIKNYIYKNDSNPYETIIKNIHNILQYNIHLSIRINYNPNENEVIGIYKTLAEEFKDNKNVYIYIIPLFTTYSKDEQIEIIKNHIRYRYISNSDTNFLQKFKYARCAADSPDSIQIAPNGDIYKCQHVLYGDGKIININDYYDNNINVEDINQYIYDDSIYSFFEFKSCKECVFNPSCLNIKCCNNSNYDDCPLYVKFINKFDLETGLLQYYYNYKENIKSNQS